jgi:penicillin-binding protein 1C
VDICWPLGIAQDKSPPETCQQKHTAWVLDGVVPPTLPERDARNWNTGLLHVRVDASNGLSLGPDCDAEHVDERAIARWPLLVYPWLSREMRRRSSVPAPSPGCRSGAFAAVQSLRIDGIPDNSVLARAPNSDKPASVRLRALGASGEVQWLFNGRLESTTRGTQSFEHSLTDTGNLTITAMTESGAWDQVQVRVLR